MSDSHRLNIIMLRSHINTLDPIIKLIDNINNPSYRNRITVCELKSMIFAMQGIKAYAEEEIGKLVKILTSENSDKKSLIKLAEEAIERNR